MILGITSSQLAAQVLAHLETQNGSALLSRLKSPQFRTRAADMYLQQKYPNVDGIVRNNARNVILSTLDTSTPPSNTKTTTTDSPDSSATPEQNATAMKEAGNVAFAAHDYQAALDLYNQALTFTYPPMLSILHANVAACALATQDYAAAVSAAQSCLALEPENLKALYRLASAQQQMGLVESALTSLTRGLELDDGLYSDKSKKKSIKAIRKAREELLNTLEEKQIESYSFSDEGKPKVKVYVSLEGVGMLPSDDVQVEWGRISMNLIVRGYKGKNLRMYAAELWSSINPEKCKLRIKPNMIVLTLHKAQNDGMRPWEKLRR